MHEKNISRGDHLQTDKQRDLYEEDIRKLTLEEELTTYRVRGGVTDCKAQLCVDHVSLSEGLETFWAHVAWWFRAQAQKSDWLGFQCQLYHQLADFREVTQPFHVLAFYIYKIENVVFSYIQVFPMDDMKQFMQSASFIGKKAINITDIILAYKD